jgi:Heterokaryon incompatibility protein (HET)
MEVTMSLGFRYLWVDKYCIDQANHSKIQEQILIYNGSDLTIVANLLPLEMARKVGSPEWER